MSAIGGILYTDGRRVQKSDLQKMSESVKHRGPDNQNFWNNGQIGLFSNMLITTPEAEYETLPLKIGNYTITADARIDNRNELFSKLRIEPPYNKVSDSELILSSYIKWKNDCPSHLIGDFAFAIWDGIEKTIFCSRDFIGVRPFFYSFQNNTFIFGSEIKCIFSVAPQLKLLNEIRIADFLVEGLEGHNKISTSYEHVLKLVPGHSLTVGLSDINIKKYWNFCPENQLKFKGPEEATEAYIFALKESVRSRLRLSSAPGFMLSGGLDSSSIVCLSKEMIDNFNLNTVQTYSASSINRHSCPETPFINEIIKDDRINETFISPLSTHERDTELSNFFNSADETFDYTMPMIDMLYISAHNAKRRVLFDASVADNIIDMGLNYIRVLFLEKKMRTIFKELNGYAKTYEKNVFNLYWSYFIKPVLRRYVGNPYLERRYIKYIKEFIESTLLNLRYFDEKSIIERFKDLYKYELHNELYGTDPVSEKQNFHLNSVLHPFITVALERYNMAASYFSIEPRNPFCDQRFVELCLSIPDEYKLHNGWSKALHRLATANILPEKIRWRIDTSHVGHEYTTNYFFRNNQFNNLISDSKEILSKYVDYKRTLKKHNKDRESGSLSWEIWKITCLAHWLNKNTFN